MRNLEHLKLAEPVRLYLYSLLVLLVSGLGLAGVLTGDWQRFALEAGAAVLVVGAGTEAARASVFSPRTVVQTAMRARGIDGEGLLPPITVVRDWSDRSLDVVVTAGDQALNDLEAGAASTYQAGRHHDLDGDGRADGAR